MRIIACLKGKGRLGIGIGVILFGIGLQGVFGWNWFRSNEYSQTLAGEKVLLDSLHQFNIERLDRELAINKMNEDQMMMIWKRMPKFRPFIEKKLKAAGIPTDIFYLVLAESALRETAISSAGAAGLWQFMPATAKSHGLRVDEFIDERFHLEKATDAAIQYLQKAYERFGNWTLAMAAYNRGVKGIETDMTTQFQNNFYDLYLNNETSRYIFRILAFKEVFENLTTYFVPSKWGNQYQIPSFTEITVEQIPDLAAWAASRGYTYLELRTLNPWIRKNALPAGKWTLKVYKR